MTESHNDIGAGHGGPTAKPLRTLSLGVQCPRYSSRPVSECSIVMAANEYVCAACSHFANAGANLTATGIAALLHRCHQATRGLEFGSGKGLEK